MVYSLLLLDIIFTVCAQISLRIGAQRITAEELSLSLLIEPLRNLYILAGLVLFGFSFFLYIFILSKINLSVAYPIATGSIIAIVAVLSHFILKETLTGVQAIGIAAILIGIVLVLLPR